MASRRGLNLVGAAGAGLVTGIAVWTAVNRAVVRRLSRADDPVGPHELELPDGVREHTLTMSDGWVIRVIERGPKEGPPVLLLHGVTLAASVWPYQLGSLADDGFRVLAVDLRGHGQSGGSASDERAGDPGSITFDRLAADVAEVLEALDLDQVVMVGHSMGGMVALHLLGLDQELAGGAGRVSGLVLAATTANPTQRRGLALLTGPLTVARPLVASASGLAARLPGPTRPALDMGFMVSRFSFGEQRSPRQVAFTGRLSGAVPVRVSSGLLVEILRFNASDGLARIAVPTSVVVGDKDLITPPAQAEDLAAHIAGAELVVLAGCGHMVMLERPDELNRVISGVADRAAG